MSTRPGTLGRPHVHPLEVVAQLAQRRLRARDDVGAVEQLVGLREVGVGLLDRRDERVGVEALVVGDVAQEVQVGLQVELVGGHARDDLAGRVLGGAQRADVADGAVQADHPDLRRAEARPDRPGLALLVEQADALIALAGALGQQVAEDLGQREPERRGNAGPALGADRPVLEVLDDVGLLLGIAARHDERADDPHHDEPHHDDGDPDLHAGPRPIFAWECACTPALPPRVRLAGIPRSRLRA